MNDECKKKLHLHMNFSCQLTINAGLSRHRGNDRQFGACELAWSDAIV